MVHTLLSAARTQPIDRHEVLILHWNVDYTDVAHLIANTGLRIDYSYSPSRNFQFINDLESVVSVEHTSNS